MAQNLDYISMLNMPAAELSPLASTDGDFQNDLDLWLTADFNFDNAGGGDFGDRTKGYGFGIDTAAATNQSQSFHSSPLQQSQQLQQPQQQQQTPMSFAQPAAAPLIAPSTFAQPAIPQQFPGLSTSILGSAVSNDLASVALQQVLAAAAGISLAPLATTRPFPAAAEQHTSAAATTSTPEAVKPAAASAEKKAVVTEEREKTLEEIDKRRRNTAASARFRLKKKQREQALEQTAREMSEKAAKLELRVKEYEMELKWLRQLVTDRDGKKRLRDFYDESGLSFSEGTMAAGCGIENPSIELTAAASAAFAGAFEFAATASVLGEDFKRRRVE